MLLLFYVLSGRHPDAVVVDVAVVVRQKDDGCEWMTGEFVILISDRNSGVEEDGCASVGMLAIVFPACETHIPLFPLTLLFLSAVKHLSIDCLLLPGFR